MWAFLAFLLTIFSNLTAADVLWQDDYNGWSNSQTQTDSDNRKYHGVFTRDTVMSRVFKCHTSGPEFLALTVSAAWCSSAAVNNDDIITVYTLSAPHSVHSKVLSHYPWMELSDVAIDTYSCSKGVFVHDDLSFFVPTSGGDVLYLEFTVRNSQYLLLYDIELSCLSGANITVPSSSTTTNEQSLLKNTEAFAPQSDGGHLGEGFMESHVHLQSHSDVASDPESASGSNPDSNSETRPLPDLQPATPPQSMKDGEGMRHAVLWTIGIMVTALMVSGIVMAKQFGWFNSCANVYGEQRVGKREMEERRRELAMECARANRSERMSRSEMLRMDRMRMGIDHGIAESEEEV